MTQALIQSPVSGRDSGWRLALPLLIALILALLGLYRETAMAMVGIWQRSDTFAHAFIVPPIALWLIWRRRARLALMNPRPSLWFALPLLMAGAAWLLGALVAVNALAQAGLVLMVIACVPLMLGAQVAAAMAFPLGFLLFCVPAGEFLMPSLMESTADFTVLALRMSGIPVYREGLQFVIPSGNWSVVEACSGLRYLIASVMVGTLFAYLSYKSLKRRLAFIAFATVLPIVANWLRAYLIVMLGHHSGNELAVGADHLVYGWVFFGVVMFAMFMVGARWADSEPESAPTGTAGHLSQQPVASVPFWLAAACLALAAVLPHQLLRAMEPAADPLASPRLHLAALTPWQPRDHVLPSWKPVFERPAAEFQQSYEQGGRAVGLHLAYYRHQSHESKLVSSSNTLVRSEDTQWSRVHGASRSMALGGETVSLHDAELRGLSGAEANTRLRVWQFYWIGGRLTDSPVHAKLLTAWNQLSGEGDDAASVIVYTRSSVENAAVAEETLKSFLSDNWPAIAAALQSAQRVR